MCRFYGFLGDEKGAVTIEFTVIVPFFILLLVFFADTSLVYLTHSEMFNAARDIARKMSVDTLTTQDEVMQYAAEHMFLGNRTYTVGVHFGSDMTVRISVPLADAAFTGYFFTPVLGRELSATATMSREPLN